MDSAILLSISSAITVSLVIPFLMYMSGIIKSMFIKASTNLELIYTEKIKREAKISIKYKKIYDNGNKYSDYTSNDAVIEALKHYIGNHSKFKSAHLDFDYDRRGTPHCYNIIPVNNVIHDNMHILIYNENDNTNDLMTTSDNVIIRSTQKTRTEIIDFIRIVMEEYTEYRKSLNSQYKDCRYFLPMIVNKKIKFKLYQIPYDSRYLSFDNLFFPEKDLIIKMLTDLGNKKIQKATILLYGEPGCGKSSVIKACSNFDFGNGRKKNTIINIDLSQIMSDDILFDIVQSNTYELANDVKIEINRESKIILFEDIDANTSILDSRKNNKTINTPAEPKHTMADKQIIAEDILIDKKTLSGFLNIMDGFVPLTDILTIITTNHIDHLDPAVIRPGRIDLMIELKRMLKSDAVKLIKSIKGYDIDENIMNDYQFTAARVMEMCLMANSVEELETVITL